MEKVEYDTKNQVKCDKCGRTSGLSPDMKEKICPIHGRMKNKNK